MDNLVPTELWRHPEPTSTRIYELKSVIEKKHKVVLHDYDALHEWSIANLSSFWEEIWHFTGIRASAPFTEVLLCLYQFEYPAH